MKIVCLGEGPADLYSATSMKRLNTRTGCELADSFQTDIKMQKLAAGSGAAMIRI